MPYYSELGLYTTPSSTYSVAFAPGPYANHSSIIAASCSRPLPTTALLKSRNLRGYKPHLSTIAEAQSHLRRINTPAYYKPARRPAVINTADIDVSVNRYRKYERPPDKPDRKTALADSPRGSVEQREARPNARIRRDRATVRIQTIHKDLIPDAVIGARSWRENFDADELGVEGEKKVRKTPGEMLIEKFLIRDASPDASARKPSVKKRGSGGGGVQKTPSFHDICSAITDDKIDEELNPGQPLEVQRRQSRRISTEDILKELRRTSLTDEQSEMFNVHTCSEQDEPAKIKHDPRVSVKKRKKAAAKVKGDDLASGDAGELPLHRRETQKKVKKSRSNVNLKRDIDANGGEDCQDIIRDISNVEIETILIRPKPVFTATVDIEEKSKPLLKAVIDEVEIEESPKPKKGKKFKFNVVVEEIVEKNIDKDDKDIKQNKIHKHHFVNQLPKAKQPIITSILKKNSNIQKVDVLENFKVFPNKKTKNLNKNDLKQQKEDSNIRVSENLFLENIETDENNEMAQTEDNNNQSKMKEEMKDNVSENHQVNEKDETETNNIKQDELSAEIKENNNIQLKENKHNFKEDRNEINYCETLESRGSVYKNSTSKDRVISKRSLVVKANKDDPDLMVFEPPPGAEQAKEEEKCEESPGSAFVPLRSNRLSQFMHPFKKPEQFEECPVEIFARPKTIRKRHYPRPRHAPPPPAVVQEEEDEESSSEVDESSDDDTASSTSEDCSDHENGASFGYIGSKVGASTSSTDSGFESGKKKGSASEARDSPQAANPACNPAFSMEAPDAPAEEYPQSSTFTSFQKSGRITPPATTIPRFRKYCVDDFNFLKVLGKGSFGKVLLAELKNTEYYYAIKCLKKDVVLEDDDVECTLIERKVLALGTKHPYLCHLLCTFQTESHLFFVMEYLNGGDLMFHIQQTGRFSESRARFYGAEIVSGLKFLHNKGIVYRDLKLDNILLDFDGHVRIADFGMCKLQIFLDRMAETFCGTPDYMAPEIIKGQHYNQCVDWWSFGVLLYEMLIGQSPFSGCDEDELFWSICNEKPVMPRFLSAEASAILTLFLEKDAAKRLGHRFCPKGDIQDQPFFRPIDWHKLEARQLEAPFRPNLQHPLDTQYFDRTFTVERAKLTPIDHNILQSMDQTQFQGFSYTNPNATDK